MIDLNKEKNGHTVTGASHAECNTSRVIRCCCAKTKCVKMYCECFRNHTHCSVNCGCTKDCLNNKRKQRLRKGLVPSLKSFGPIDTINKLSSSKEERGCTCKKSSCLKKYCDCFMFGVKCSEKCSCLRCGNMIKKPIRTDFFIGFTPTQSPFRRKALITLSPEWYVTHN